MINSGDKHPKVKHMDMVLQLLLRQFRIDLIKHKQIKEDWEQQDHLMIKV